jgi:programmed cell death protein 4
MQQDLVARRHFSPQLIQLTMMYVTHLLTPGRTQNMHTRRVNHDRAGLKGNAGATKKNGGGASYTWGLPGDEMNAPIKIDPQDPNYDSEAEDEGVVLVSSLDTQERLAKLTGNTRQSYVTSPPTDLMQTREKAPKTPLAEFKKVVTVLIAEYFTSEDVEEFMRGVEELDSSILHFDLVRRAINMAMERKDRERELTSRLLCELRGHGLLSIEQCGKGFERIFELIDDLVLDNPHAKKQVAQFLARGIADEILAPCFLSNPLVESLGGEMVEQAKVLLSIKHGVVRLERVWGLGEGSPVEMLKPEIKLILNEYLSSGDIDDSCECIKKLNVPHFHHEVVKRAIVIAMDKEQRERAMMSSLLDELVRREVVSTQQFQLGFTRVVQEADDLELDTPGAKEILRVFVSQALSDGCLGKTIAEDLLTQIVSVQA